jgi:hypothetical protein
MYPGPVWDRESAAYLSEGTSRRPSGVRRCGPPADAIATLAKQTLSLQPGKGQVGQ